MAEARSFKDHFSALASQYAAFRPTYPTALFEYLASLCAGRRQAWDCACGTGQATVGLASCFESVIGTDASPEQLAAATPHPGVTYRVATAEHSGLEPQSVDIVTVAQALHWFDVAAFYREVDRVLRAGGVLAVWSYGVLQVEGAEVDAHIRSFYQDTVGPYWPPERRHVDEGYQRLPFPYPLLTSPGSFNLEVRWSLPRLMGYVRSWSATGRYVERHGVDPVVALEGSLAAVWEDPARERLVRWPLLLRAGHKPREL
jgi:SAM-dependent methyltransferase